MSFFRSPKFWKAHGERLGCTEDVEVFPSQISKDYPSPDWQYGDGRYHAKGWFRPTEFQGVWHATMNFACSSTLSDLETNHAFLLFFPCLHLHCWTNTLYTTLTSRAIRKQLVNLCVFTMHVSYPTDGSINTYQQCCQVLRGMYFSTDVRFSFDWPS